MRTLVRIGLVTLVAFGLVQSEALANDCPPGDTCELYSVINTYTGRPGWMCQQQLTDGTLSPGINGICSVPPASAHAVTITIDPQGTPSKGKESAWPAVVELRHLGQVVDTMEFERTVTVTFDPGHVDEVGVYFVDLSSGSQPPDIEDDPFSLIIPANGVADNGFSHTRLIYK